MASIAAVVLVAFVIQLWVAVDVPGTPRAHAVGTLAGAPLASRIVRVLSFFTVQSNILSGVTCAVLALAPDRDGSRWRPVRLAALFGITVTGIVYATVLARIHEPHGWRETVANTAFHYIVPVMMVLGWLMFGPRPRIEVRTVGLALLWPVAWITYTLVHGALSSWYPYPFVDVITHGYARVLVNGALVVIVLAIVTALGSWSRGASTTATGSNPASLGLIAERVRAHPAAPPPSADISCAASAAFVRAPLPQAWSTLTPPAGTTRRPACRARQSRQGSGWPPPV